MVKKRLALAVVALLLLAGGCMTTAIGTRCRPKVELLTPDGSTFELNFGAGWTLGSAASVVGLSPEATGLPTVSWTTDKVYHVPGVLVRDHAVEPRIFTITVSAWSRDGTRAGLHESLGEIYDAVRWDRGPSRTSVSTLRVTIGDDSWDLDVVYQAAIEGPQGRYGLNEIVGVRMLAPDPTWRSATESSLVLDWEDAYTMRSIAAKLNGIWSPLGPPTAVGGARDVNSIVEDPVTGNIIVGGWFTGWDGLPGVTGDNIVQYNVTTNTWQAIGGGLDNTVKRVYVGPDETIYAVGWFDNGSGGAGDAAADGIAQYNRATDTWVNVGGGPGAAVGPDCEDMVIGHDGTLYLVGWFTNWNGIGAADRLVSLPLPYAAGGWAAVGTPDAGGCFCAEIGLNGHLFIGGDFANIGAVPANRIAEYDPVAGTWAALNEGFNSTPYDLLTAADGSLYIGGSFVTLGLAGDPMLYIARWNGVSFTDLDGGMNGNVYRMALADDGSLYSAGAFTQAGSLTIPDSIARWNGYSWTHLDINIPGAGGGTTVSVIDGDIWLGFDTAAGTGYVAGNNTVVNAGSAATYPIIEIKNQGLVRSIRNEMVGGIATEPCDIPCNMLIQDGEIVTIDLSTGRKTVSSTWRPLGRLSDILPNSDLGEFKLESGPRAQYGGVDGANLVTVFISDADPREHNDGGNQLSGWEGVTGISQDNTDLGRLYASVVVVGGGFNRVDFFMDAARAEQVAHTANYNAPGAQAIVEDNDSGLGGTITIDLVGAGDVDIFAWYTIVTATWHDRWGSLSEAIADAVS